MILKSVHLSLFIYGPTVHKYKSVIELHTLPHGLAPQILLYPHLYYFLVNIRFPIQPAVELRPEQGRPCLP